MNEQEKAAKEIEIFGWLNKQGYDRRASKDIAPIIVRYLETEVNKNFVLADVINCVAAPEWLTEDVRVRVKKTWNEHTDHNDNKRISAMRIVQSSAKAAGYTIGIKKATELLKQHCL